jgi:hypothetical protein
MSSRRGQTLLEARVRVEDVAVACSLTEDVVSDAADANEEQE